MKITKIIIKNHKSITEPVEINFSDNLPTVLIGKNGSGKSNILEALSIIAEANSNFSGARERIEFDYEVHIRLTEQDVSSLFPGKVMDIDKCSLIAYSCDKMKIDRIKSDYLIPLFHSDINEIRTKAQALKKMLGSYQEQLHLISTNEDASLPSQWYEISHSRRSFTNYAQLSWVIQRPVEDAERICDSLIKNFSLNQSVFNFEPSNGFDYFPIDNDFSFELKYVKPDLAPFEEKHITIDETALKIEIEEMNKKTQDLSEKITTLLKELDDHTGRLNAALRDNESPFTQPNDHLYHFIHEIRKCVGSQCAFLKNEIRDVIFTDKEKEQPLFYDNNAASILKTYVSKVYQGENKAELLKQISSNRVLTLSEQEISDFERYLNEHLPDFENGMYKKISVEKQNDRSLTILLHEKCGEIVNFNATSAGRRWYFTYFFTKNALEPGDLFIIDEPAASLHPLAQKEVLQELLELKKQGINVIYSTHSPYLIPDEWECVHFVSMGENGTEVNLVASQKESFAQIKETIGNDIFDLQLMVEKYKDIGAKAAANNAYKMLIEKYKSPEIAADKVGFSESTLEAWKKKKRGTSLENLIYLADIMKISVWKLLTKN